jgi:tetratricopeptide (TPR) repeat protein
MQSTRLPDHMRVFAADNPDVQIQVSITVDPLVVDDLQREAKALPIVRIMERTKFLSETEAQRYFQNLMLRASSKELLADTDEEKGSDEARALVVQAFLSSDNNERIAAATEALALWPKCAEAYIVLAQAEDDFNARINLLEKAIGIACAQFDCARFENPEGFFWQKLTTRPYMRCRAALALALWEHGQKQTAIEHVKTLLKLNPHDNQGMRFLLLSWLLDFDAADSSIDEYFKKYEHEHSAFGRYAFVLWNFIRLGNEKRSLKALRKALEANKFVPAFLCGLAAAPNFTVKRVVRGSVPEAVAYYCVGSNAWQRAEGAIAWLKDNCASLLSSKTLFRKIETAEEWKSEGVWAGPMPMELSIAQNTVWR